MKSIFEPYGTLRQRVIGIIGTRPNVGATTTALAIAAASVPHRAAIPLVIEGNIADPKVHRHLGIVPIAPSFEPLSFNFHEHIRLHPAGFQVIPQHHMVSIHPHREEHIEQLLSEAITQHALIIIPHTPHEHTNLIFNHLQEVLLVTDTSREGIHNLQPLNEAARAQKHTILGVVLNKAKPGKEDSVVDYIERMTGLSVINAIPHDMNVVRAREHYTPITAYPPAFRSPAERGFTLLARKLL